MAIRRPLMQLTTSDGLRDYCISLLRSSDPLKQPDRETIARAIEQHWRSDRKRDKRVARAKKALQKNDEIKRLREEGLTVEQARRTLTGKSAHGSADALKKSLQRNLPYRRRSTRSP